MTQPIDKQYKIATYQHEPSRIIPALSWSSSHQFPLPDTHSVFPDIYQATFPDQAPGTSCISIISTYTHPIKEATNWTNIHPAITYTRQYEEGSKAKRDISPFIEEEVVNHLRVTMTITNLSHVLFMFRAGSVETLRKLVGRLLQSGLRPIDGRSPPISGEGGCTYSHLLNDWHGGGGHPPLVSIHPCKPIFLDYTW